MVADFIREPEFTQFDAEARDVGVGYNNLFRGIAVTVFVYPVAVQPPDDTLKGHFGTCKAQVQRKHSDAKQVFEGKVQVTPGGRKHEGLQAVFTFTDVFAGKRQPVRSELYLFTHRQFFLCFRVTYVVGSQAKAEPDIKAFIDGLAWPEEQMRNQILKTTSR